MVPSKPAPIPATTKLVATRSWSAGCLTLTCVTIGMRPTIDPPITWQA